MTVVEATAKKDSAARRELYGMLAMRFGDTDVDKDGKIIAAEFDSLCEDIASLPRRAGLAPGWEMEYGTIGAFTLDDEEGGLGRLALAAGRAR